MFTYNIGFKTSTGFETETQLDATNEEELNELIESLKEEMDIAEILYIEEGHED